MDRKGDRTQIRSTLEKRNAEILQVKNEITKILQVPKTRTCLNAELPQLDLLRFECIASIASVIFLFFTDGF